jgi:hypothetical protein
MPMAGDTSKARTPRDSPGAKPFNPRDLPRTRGVSGGGTRQTAGDSAASSPRRASPGAYLILL